MLNGVFYNCGGDGGGPLVVLVGRVKENMLKGYFMIVVVVVVVMVRRWCDNGGGGGCHGCGWKGQGKHGNKRHFVQVVLFQEVQM